MAEDVVIQPHILELRKALNAANNDLEVATHSLWEARTEVAKLAEVNGQKERRVTATKRVAAAQEIYDGAYVRRSAAYRLLHEAITPESDD